MRCLKNDAPSAKRGAEKKLAECQKLRADNRKWRALVGGIEHKTPARLGTNVQCVDELQQQNEGLKEDTLRLVDEAAAARELIESAVLEGKLEGVDPFLSLVGKKGDQYSQDMIELGLKLMSRSLSSVQAWSHNGLRNDPPPRPAAWRGLSSTKCLSV
jgi:hypothetical protein